MKDLSYCETYCNQNFLQYEIEERSLKYWQTIKTISLHFLTIFTLIVNRTDV